MAKESKNTGFQPAAGLIRYFDAEEETALHIDPRFVMVAAFVIAIGIAVMNTFYPAG